MCVRVCTCGVYPHSIGQLCQFFQLLQKKYNLEEEINNLIRLYDNEMTALQVGLFI